MADEATSQRGINDGDEARGALQRERKRVSPRRRRDARTVKSTGDENSTTCLHEALTEHHIFNKRVSHLHAETSKLLTKIQTKLGIGDENVEISFPIAELKEVESTLKKSPAIIFIGNRNCGKSSLLNELLQGTYLPVHENPCTSRIVRIKYAEKDVAWLVNSDGSAIPSSEPKEIKKGELKDFVVLADKDKENKEKLGVVVEVRLKHELLRNGIELIDCPGKNETPSLDGVVEDFLMKGTAPLVVYVIDGDMQLRPTDRETIFFLREKLPHVSFMFVCNKIDTTTEAGSYDEQESDSESDRDWQDAATFQAPDKKEIVFAQLNKLYLLPEEADIDSCQVFHGISATNIRSARIQRRDDKFMNDFSRFQECLRTALAHGIKRQIRLEIDGIVSVLDQFMLAITQPRNDVPKAINTLMEVLNVASKTEKNIADNLKDQVTKNLVNEQMIYKVLVKVKRETMVEAATYQKKVHTFPTQAFEMLVAVLSTREIRKEELRAKMNFIFDISIIIGGNVSAILLSVLEKSLRSIFAAFSKDLQQAMESITVPSLKRAVCRAYGIDFSRSKGEVKDASEMSHTCLIIPTEMLRAIKGAVCLALGKETALIFGESLVAPLIRTGSQAMEKEWKETVVDSIMSKFTPQKIARVINETCKENVSKMHSRFNSTLKATLAIHNVVQALEADQNILDELCILYLPQLGQLAVKAFSLKYELDLGVVQLGDLVASGRTAKIYSCSSPAWCDSCVVRVVKEEDVDEELWNRLSKELLGSKDVLDKQTTPSPFLLHVYGWLMPAPGVLYIVMETAERDLLTSLQQGMTLENRLQIAWGVALGLKSIHEAGYICGDLKPESILISPSGTGKINMAKTTDPFQRTRLGVPFHLAPHVYKDEGSWGGRASYDIYAFGMLLWVLCDGTGIARPKAYDDHVTKAQMKIAVQHGIIPERPHQSSDACWKIMKTCWEKCSTIDINFVIEELEGVLL